MHSEITRDEALDRAIEAAGGPAALAAFITEQQEQITTQAISQWRRCPVNRVLVVERATADEKTGKPRVTRHELRPDIYPPEEATA
jgi:DNA-binding transcriptional regulator YdaS (Cro superfamily)